MPLYLDLLMLLNFLVDFLLLMGTNRLAGFSGSMKRTLAAAALGGLYGGVCMLPGFSLLASTFWRVLSLLLMAGICFGFRQNSLRRTVLFVLLSMALGGIAIGLNNGGFWSVLLAAGSVCLMCLFGFRGRAGRNYVPICVEGCRFTALIDTGNTLTDPLTGNQILVVSAGIGCKLLNVTSDQLSDPVKLIQRIPGMRLVPYHAVGCDGGVLPVKRYEKVQIGSWNGSCLVGFAPNEIGQGMEYEALTGGGL